MRRLLAPLLLVAIMASFPASILLLFIRGIVSTAKVAGSDGVAYYYGACNGVMDSYDISSYRGDVSCIIDRRSDSSLVAGLLFAHAITTHDVLPPSRYPMVMATTASIVASTTTTPTSSPSSSDSGGDVGIIRSLKAESGHNSGGSSSGSNYKPRQSRSTPGPGPSQPESGSPLRPKQPEAELPANFGGEDAAEPKSSASEHHVPHVAEAPADTLKIAILGPLRGKSRSCTYSLVEFTNTHPNETIVLHSTYIEPMVAFPPGLASNHSKSTNETPLSAFPEFEGEYDQDRHMLIPPLTAVTIPVSIIPHWRKPPEDSGNRHRHSSRFMNRNPDNDEKISVLSQTDDSEFATKTNAAIDADIIDMIASSKNRHLHLPPKLDDRPFNTAMLADISDTLFVNTSWGIIQMKIPYTCSPQSSAEDDFNLPNNLIFLDGGGGWYARRNTTPTSSTPLQAAFLFGDWESYFLNIDDFDPFIHRLYMNNPTDRELSIWEVYTTKPNLVYVEMQLQYVDSWPSSSSSLHATIDVKDFYPLKGKPHAAKQNNIYVATLRLAPLNFTLELVTARQDLGFLVVQTNVGTFNIALDFIPNAGRGGLVHGTLLERGESIAGIHLMEEYAIGKNLSSRLNSTTTVPSKFIAKTYHAKDYDFSLTANQGELSIGMGRGFHSDTYNEDDWKNCSFIAPAPRKIDFGTITTTSRLIRIPLNLTNRHTDPLRVMRISIVMNTISDIGGVNATNENNLVDIGVDFSDGSEMKQLGDGYHDSYGFTRDFWLPPSILDPNLLVWCRFNASSDETVKERIYTGSILIRTSEISGLSFSYHNWERQVLLRHSLGRSRGKRVMVSSPDVLEIPFRGSVLLGYLGSRAESLLFPTRFSNLPVEERDKLPKGASGKVPHYFDRKLEIINNFSVSITLTTMSILDSHEERFANGFCNSRFSFNIEARSSVDDHPSPLKADSGEMWKDLFIRYHFIDDDYFDGINVVRKCILSLETDRAGKQFLPLIIYSGELFVDVERSDQEGTLPVNCILSMEDGTTISSRLGIHCMKNWITNSIEGAILQRTLFQTLQQHINRGKSDDYFRKCTTARRFDPVDCYFRSLLPSSVRFDDQSQYSLQPTVISFGAVNAGESTALSLFLTNLNHIPIDVMATTAAVGNMNVTIGVKPSSLRGSFQRMSNSPRKGDVAHFLHNTSVANDFFSRFTHQFDIVPSTRALGSELLSLFQRKMVIDTFQNTSEYLMKYVGREKTTVNYPYGFLLSADGYEKSFQSRKAGKKAWTIPPGGVARLSIAFVAPDRSELKNDVTQFVGTGLMLQTNHGQVLPIVLTFSVLAGQLRLKPWFDSQGNAENKQLNGVGRAESMDRQQFTIVQVPSILADSSLEPFIHSVLHQRGVLLSLESTFRHDLYLSQIRSCNRWFSVIPHSNTSLGFSNNHDQNSYLRIRGVKNDGIYYSTDERLLNRTNFPLGKVVSMLACSQPAGETSFFTCALAWLKDRERIQPPGCGLSEEEVVTQWMSDGAKTVKRRISLDSRIITAKSNAIRAFSDAVAFLAVRYGNQTPEQGGAERMANVNSSHILMFKHARKMWDEVGALGLNMITGQINAKAIYTTASNMNRSNGEYSNSSKASEKKYTHECNYRSNQTPLPIPMTSVLLQSKIEFPILFRGGEYFEDSTGVVDFHTVHVADTAYRHLLIVNPTAMRIRVRLAAVGSVDGYHRKRLDFFHVQDTSDDHHPWWTGSSYWMSDEQGHLILANHNVTIKSGAGAFVSLLNPSLHTTSAFVLGCGNRCGLRNEYVSTGDGNDYSSIGAGSGDSSILHGRPLTGTHTENKIPQQVFSMNSPPPFSFARFSTDIYIEPNGAAELGPVYFRPPGRGDFESHIYIENSLTGFEEVKLRGRGGWENLVFLDDSSGHGGDVEFRFGKSTLVFPGSLLQDGQGKGMGPVEKSVRLVNYGDFPVDITSVFMASSEVKQFSIKRRHRSSTSSSIKRCSERGFVLTGCDESFTFGGASPWFNVMKKFIRKYFSDSALERRMKITKPEEVRSLYKDGFTLQPNQTRSVIVTHYPDCIFQTSYSSVIFELGDGFQLSNTHRKGSRQHTFRRRQVELLVGYDMSGVEFSHCVPYASSKSVISIWWGEIVSQVSPLVQEVLTFGLTQLAGKSGNPCIPRRPIEITILVALLMLLLMALSLYLVLADDRSTVPKFLLPSWKPTCRCLARADPTSSDLFSLGKEQTKHVLLSRFKKEGVLSSNCVHLDGSLNRDNIGLNGRGTHSEAIFGQLNLLNDSESNTIEGAEKETKGLLPRGLGWRTAMKRGVGLPPLPIATSHSNDNILLSRSLCVMSQKHDHKVAINVSIARATPSTSTSFQDHGVVVHNNGIPTTANETNVNLTTQQPKPKSDVEKDPTTCSMREDALTSEPKGLELFSNEGEDASFQKVENDERRELMHQRTSYPAENVRCKIVTAKAKRTHHDEGKDLKHERFSRTEFSKTSSHQMESIYNAGRVDLNQDARPTESVDSSVSYGKRIGRGRNEQKHISQTRRKEWPSNQSKARQTKKPINGTKICEGPEGNQDESTEKEAAAMSLNKYSYPTKNHLVNTPQIDTDQSTSKVSQASLQKQQFSNVRPPPGLHAPPGFSVQLDLEGVTSPSSPSSSHQRFSSPEIQLMPTCIEMSSTPPSNGDCLSLLRSENVPLANATFQPPYNNNSTMTLIGSEDFVLPFRSQTFTPPINEASPTAQSNDANAPDVQALLGAGSNFNVSNFLNGILSESTQCQQTSSRPILYSTSDVVESDPLASIAVGISLDPWNNSDIANINPLGNILQGVIIHPNSPIINGAPLNSDSSSHLHFASAEYYSELAYARNVSDEGDDSDSLEPDSFYNQLLGED